MTQHRAPFVDPHQQVTDRLIAKLEQGVEAWEKLWSDAGLGIPRRSTGDPFTGVNRLALMLAKDEKGYGSDYWLTFAQAKLLGGSVKAGEHHAAKAFRRDTWIEHGTNDRGEPTEHPRVRWIAYPVFNADQIEGLPEKFYSPPQAMNKGERIGAAEKFFEALGTDVRHGGNRAFYRRNEDRVYMPPFEAFRDPEAYYSVRAHEEIHRTGHESRLNRLPDVIRFGDEAYAFEELVAELGAAFVMADLGIALEPRDDTAAYIDGWLKVLKSDSGAIFAAAAKANDAAKWMDTKTREAEQVLAVENETQVEREDGRSAA